jgi:hypothetical protein
MRGLIGYGSNDMYYKSVFMIVCPGLYKNEINAAIKDHYVTTNHCLYQYVDNQVMDKNL